MKLRRAQKQDDSILRQYFKQFVLDGPVQLLVDRPESFFSPYQSQSEHYESFILYDDSLSEQSGGTLDPEILGCVSFSIKEMVLGDHRKKIAFGQDLRISQHRKAIMAWSEHFLPVMQELKDQHQIDYFFSVLNYRETKALNAFVRPRNLKRPMPRYHQYRSIDLHTIHGKWPFSPKPLTSIHVKTCSEAQLDELLYYILQKTYDLDLVPWFDRHSLLKQMDHLSLLLNKNVLVATDKNKNIVGCAGIWNPLNTQHLIPYHYDLRSHNFRQFLKFGNIWGWSRPLTKPIKRLKRESPLTFNYLTHLFADHADVFDSLLHTAFHRSGPDRFIAYARPINQIHLKPSLSWIQTQHSYGVYCLVTPNQELPHFLDPTDDRGIYFEPTFI